MTCQEILKDIKLDLLLNDSLKGKESITRRLSLLYLRMILFVSFLTLVVYFDLKLHPMGVKHAFLNKHFEEKVYMEQPKGSSSSGDEHFVCKLKKFIYGLKQTQVNNT